jgi:hypothetical protein
MDKSPDVLPTYTSRVSEAVKDLGQLLDDPEIAGN